MKNNTCQLQYILKVTDFLQSTTNRCLYLQSEVTVKGLTVKKTPNHLHTGTQTIDFCPVCMGKTWCEKVMEHFVQCTHYFICHLMSLCFSFPLCRLVTLKPFLPIYLFSQLSLLTAALSCRPRFRSSDFNPLQCPAFPGSAKWYSRYPQCSAAR